MAYAPKNRYTQRKDKRKRYYRHKSFGEKHHERKMKPETEPELEDIFSMIGRPEAAPFVPDPFQLEALEAIGKTDCLVAAPTGSGKTWIAENAIMSIFERGGSCWYASPLKALTNSKLVEFGNIFGYENVGILTGDTKENPDAPIIVGTTEILRNKLYDAMHSRKNLDCDLVILDEAHFLGDKSRGVVWEEIMIYLPAEINLLLLSATIENGREIADWLSSIRQKECVVVEESERPVPLYPLLLHPSGRLTPFLDQRKLHRKVISSLKEDASVKKPKGKLPPFDEIIRILGKSDLLPAIFFLKSRGECNMAVNACSTASERKDKKSFDDDLDAILKHFPFLKNHKQLNALRHSRVGSHHGGQLPAWKSMVENMMKKKHLDAVFATSTVAAGVNFPARTVVLFNSDSFNGHEFNPLDATAFHQMTGRAGRRGEDNIGFVVLFPGKFMDFRHLKDLFFSRPEKITSQIKSDFSMVLNLLLSHTLPEIKAIFKKSFAGYQQGEKKNIKSADLWKEFKRYLDFLKKEGFVNTRNKLTKDGAWASQLRLDQPVVIAECLRKDVFPKDDANMLAAIIAAFAYDGNQDVFIPKGKIPRKLTVAYNKILRTVGPVSKRMKDAGFEAGQFNIWPCVAIYRWARGFEWDHITQALKIADGDLAMLVSRTADSLRQIASLKDTHEDIAQLASTGRYAILREPVAFD